MLSPNVLGIKVLVEKAAMNRFDTFDLACI